MGTSFDKDATLDKYLDAEARLHRRMSAWYDPSDGTWSWSEAALNTWTNYTKAETSFDGLVSGMEEPPANYLAVIQGMNAILANLAAELNANLNNTSEPCFLGAKLKAV